MKCLICGGVFPKTISIYAGLRHEEDEYLCTKCDCEDKLIPIIKQNRRISRKGTKDTLDLIIGVKDEDKLQKKKILGNKNTCKETK